MSLRMKGVIYKKEKPDREILRFDGELHEVATLVLNGIVHSGITSKRLITLAEAAKILDVAKVTLRRWTNKGIIKDHRESPRGHRRFILDEVLELALVRNTNRVV